MLWVYDDTKNWSIEVEMIYNSFVLDCMFWLFSLYVYLIREAVYPHSCEQGSIAFKDVNATKSEI